MRAAGEKSASNQVRSSGVGLVKTCLWVVAFLLSVVWFTNSKARAQAAANHQPSTPAVTSTDQLQAIVTRLEQTQQANPARYRPYALTREYKFYHGDTTSDPKSEVVAEVSFVPPNIKSFEILDSRGSGRGTSVVKHLLENEAELSKDVTTNEISRRNYDFALAGEDLVNGRNCYVLDLKARREERSLFNGKVFIDAQSYRILKLEGQPSRSPSWWLKNTYITLLFGDVDGLWLPVATKGTSELRIFGRYTLASQKIGQRVGTDVASVRRPLATEVRKPNARHEKHSTRVSDVGAVVPLR
jgi:hypothetical protein